MASLYVTRAHPNPIGKDKLRWDPPSNEKLNEEWVEFRNITVSKLQLAGVSLHDNTYDSNCSSTGERQLTPFTGELESGGSVCVHTGAGQNSFDGDVHHLYLGRQNFVWNNRCGDRVVLRVNGDLLDWAYYDPNPPEGGVLRRREGTNKLE
jgi:hypothetical protein